MAAQTDEPEKTDGWDARRRGMFLGEVWARLEKLKHVIVLGRVDSITIRTWVMQFETVHGVGVRQGFPPFQAIESWDGMDEMAERLAFIFDGMIKRESEAIRQRAGGVLP